MYGNLFLIVEEFILLGVVLGAAALLGIKLPAGFIPEEDQGYFIVNIATPPSTSLSKYSPSLPFLRRPQFLTGEFAGDVGFDPLGLSSSSLSRAASSGGSRLRSYITSSKQSPRNTNCLGGAGRCNSTICLSVIHRFGSWFSAFA